MNEKDAIVIAIDLQTGIPLKLDVLVCLKN